MGHLGLVLLELAVGIVVRLVRPLLAARHALPGQGFAAAGDGLGVAGGAEVAVELARVPGVDIAGGAIVLLVGLGGRLAGDGAGERLLVVLSHPFLVAGGGEEHLPVLLVVGAVPLRTRSGHLLELCGGEVEVAVEGLEETIVRTKSHPEQLVSRPGAEIDRENPALEGMMAPRTPVRAASMAKMTARARGMLAVGGVSHQAKRPMWVRTKPSVLARATLAGTWEMPSRCCNMRERTPAVSAVLLPT